MRALALAALTLLGAAEAPAQSRQQFCRVWDDVCRRTCPGVSCTAECATRMSGCLQNGCYRFNRPRDRCLANADDVAAMRDVSDRMRRGQPIGGARR